MSDTLPPSARLRERLLDALIPLAPTMGWSEAARRQATLDAGMTAGEALLACPNGVGDLIDTFANRADQVMLAEMAKLDLSTMRVRDKVRAAIMARVLAIEPVKQAGMAMSRVTAKPQHAPELTRVLWRSADLIWRAIGDESTDFNFYTKRMTLSATLVALYLFWYRDKSEGYVDTWAFLDARLENIMQFEKFKARLKPKEGGPVSAAADTLLGLAARMRYGG